MRKLKKAVSLALALALCLGLTIPAFADSAYDYSVIYAFDGEEDSVYHFNYSANGYTDPSAENVTFSVAPIGMAKIRWVFPGGTSEYAAYVFDQDCTVTRKDGLPFERFSLPPMFGDIGYDVSMGIEQWAHVEEEWAWVEPGAAGIRADRDDGWAFHFAPESGEDWSPLMMSKKGLDTVFPYELVDEWWTEERITGTVVEYRPLSGQPTTPEQPQQPAGTTASPTNDKLEVNGNAADPTVYKIGDSNYFKIRDVAALLNGTEKQFAVGYDGSKNAVTATTGQGYDKQSGDLAGAATGGSQTADPSNDAIYVNGEKITAEVYKINGSNYFKLRDLGKALNFYVGWSADRGMYIETNKPYSE